MARFRIPRKILVIDDHPLILTGIKMLLKSQWPKLTVLTATDTNEGLDAYRKHRPNLCLVDYRLNGSTGLDLTKMILEIDDQALLIMLTMFDSMPVALNFLKLGGKGFLAKDGEVEEIFNGIKAVWRGDYYFHSRHEKELAQWIKKGFDNTIPKLEFTQRELEVCLKISKGLTTREIANELDLSVRTVETYRQRLIEKAGVKNAPELVEYVYRNGIQ